ncbi:MAG TPA: aldehyde dehydrogenase family protein [Acidimicrobiia bacterium]|nr:aldehyde dehydrogenase family protein [Acidimicrobiia bacterium]
MTLLPSKPDAVGRYPATPAFLLDAGLSSLASRAEAWLEVPLPDKIEYLATVRKRTLEVSDDLVADAIRSKGVGEGLAGEDWLGGIVIQMRTMRFLEDTLRAIVEAGRPPIRPGDISERPDGQVVVRVMPGDSWDRLAYRGWTADVWIDPDIGRTDLWDHVGGIHTKPHLASAGVDLVLGAGNQLCIAPLDLVQKLFIEGRVAMLKYNPVNDYMGPYLEYAFGELIRDGFVRTAYGGADVGDYLAHHELVDAVHITGSARTFDILVFGPGEEGARRKAAGEPILGKPITGELGNVSPTIVVPGRWSDRALRYQAEHIAFQMLQNDGFNCTATKSLIVARDWAHKEAFIQELRRVLLRLPSRPAYYPGAEERWDRFVANHEDAEILGHRGPGVVPPVLLHDVDEAGEHLAFAEESFCSVTAITELGGDGPADFLRNAVAFCNDRLDGTLMATVVVDPQTEQEIASDLDEAIVGLRYGTVSLNIHAAAGFALGQTPWGGYPGATVADIESGIGFVHNARIIDRPQKTVIRSPFVITPKPPFFLTHRRSTPAMRAAAHFDGDPSILRLVRLMGYAAAP